jgi:hypothetical protein
VRDVFAREAVVAEFFLREAVGGLVVRLGPLADGPDRQLLGPCGQASAVQVFEHPSAPCGHGAISCTEGWME